MAKKMGGGSDVSAVSVLTLERAASCDSHNLIPITFSRHALILAMARSLLLALLVLVALLQVALTAPAGLKRIFNREFDGTLQVKQGGSAVVVGRDKNDFGVWAIRPQKEGAHLYNPRTGNYLGVNGDKVVVTADRRQTWSLESAGPGVYKIKLPNEDLVLDVDGDSKEAVLRRSNGSVEQLWQFVSSVDYSRMYRQC
ncbi:hypothetical protein BGZ70_009569 [Mortierella alpina]|uniref:Ricin B lectin domain-containing protein n=1 Tax=Mortierella alpina TaxID=64518 RepID=A0A9P6JD07_MORAP|nr:hypothetical protein BGZ70_009569 [Mortierella alpina]